jgi:hypothetical protein
MDKAAMVSIDVGKGAQLVEALELANLKLGVALWAYLSDYENWRLVVSARALDSLELRSAYGFVFDSLRSAGFTPENTPPIMILRMTDPFIKALRRRFGKTLSVDGMRLGGQLIGDPAMWKTRSSTGSRSG